MNFFQLQNKLFYSKKDVAGELDMEGEQAFAPFLLNRWLSFYGKETPNFVNDTLNKYYSLFDDKQRSYRMYFHFIPRLKFKKITYVKKLKKSEEVDKDKELLLIAKSKNISLRELKQYVDLFS